MDYKKTLKIALYALLVVIALTLYNKWNMEHPDVAPTTNSATPTSSVVPTTQNVASSSSTVPVVANAASGNTQITPTVAAATNNLIWVQTDVLKAAIDPVGGNVVQTYLLKYPEQLHSANSFQLFNNASNQLYVAQSGLTGANGPDTTKGQVTYQSAQKNYQMADNQNILAVKLTYQQNGVNFVKTYTFTRGKYAVNMTYDIVNKSAKPWSGNLYTQLIHHGVENGYSVKHMTTYTGAAVSSPDNHYKKLSFSDMQEKNYSASNNQGWAAMIQHYFLSAWVPDATQTYNYYTRADNNNYTIGMVGPTLSVASGQQASTSAQLYVGPAVAAELDQVAPHLNLTIDYGFLWPISIILFWILKHVFDFLGNWGWAIIIVTLIIKLCFWWLSAKSYRSMAHMRRLQPKMTQIRERFADDKAAQTKAMMELYKKEKCNPMGGCLPMVVQIPFFFAFYYMISASVELRQAPFLLWIHDLSIPDPYYILPLIMGASMFLQQRLNPPAPDPMQQKIMMFLPVVFTFVFLNFPAGLVLYWITNNVVSIAQQWWITRRVEAEESKTHGHNKKR